jgi:hypothetical protein
MNIIITAIGTHAQDGSFRVHGRGAIVDVIETPNGEFLTHRAVALPLGNSLDRTPIACFVDRRRALELAKLELATRESTI